VLISNLILLGAVLVAIAAAVVALVIGALDRRNAREIADKDRRAAARQAQLLFEQQELLRLLQNARQGGSTDPVVRAQLGGEAAGIIGLIGPDRLPMNWKSRVTGDEELDLAEFVNDPARPEWQRRSVEIQLLLNDISAEIKTLWSEPVASD